MSRHTRSSSAVAMLSLLSNNVQSANCPLLDPATRTSRKGHHRTCSSPIRFPSDYVQQQQQQQQHHDNIYVQSSSRYSDLDSSSDYPYQRTFINSQVLKNNQINDVSENTNE
jgi:hypothetical protein